MNAKRVIAPAMLAMSLATGAMALSAPATALPVVGAANQGGDQGDQGAGTQTGVAADQLRITLTKGNPEMFGDTSDAALGSVAGVTITLQRLEGVDPTNQEHIKRISKMEMDKIRAQYKVAQTFEKVTGQDGSVVFTNLPKGVYIASSAAPQDGGKYRTFQPFLVAMPFHTLDKTADPVEGVVVAKTTGTPPTTTVPVPPPTTVPVPPPTSTTVPPTSTTTASVPPGETPPTQVPPGKVPPGTPPGETAKPPSRLAMTGAAVFGVIVVALALISAGVFIIAAGRRKNQGEA